MEISFPLVYTPGSGMGRRAWLRRVGLLPGIRSQMTEARAGTRGSAWRGTVRSPPEGRRRSHDEPGRTGNQRALPGDSPGKVIEIFTLQDQFAMLKQIGYLPESVYAA
jgi:hypothetical protein